jgi:hypothetical protein
MLPEEDRIKIDAQIEEALEILRNLSKEYKFHFALNMVTYDDQNELAGYGVYCDDLIKSGTFMQFIEQLYALQQKQLSVIPNLLQVGYTIVICDDDDKKPKDWTGDWIKKGMVYIVSNTRKMVNGEYCYVLRGVQPNPPYDGFTCKRFSRIIIRSIFN